MRLAHTSRHLVAAALIGAAFFTPGVASAQEEPSQEHIAAARATIDALGATDRFDAILPNAAARLKSTLIQATPNFEQQITDVVDATAIDLAGRRADLEREAAAIYARNFTQEELEAITAFYTSEAGMKLIEQGPQVTRELAQAAEIWANGIQRDLASQADATLEEQLGGSTSGDADAAAE